MIVLQPTISEPFNRLQGDETWQGGLDDDERRIALDFALAAFILASNRGWNMERMSARVRAALNTFKHEVYSVPNTTSETFVLKRGEQSVMVEK